MLGVAVVLVCSACYHATIETGLPSGNETVSKAWAHGWLWGLVPPSTVETASRCKNGVAKVETQMSFLNMLANFITSGIYSPMQIDVTCASSNHMALSPSDDGNIIHAKDRSAEAARAAIAEAAAISQRRHQAVFVQF
jgi:hypothetical protein